MRALARTHAVAATLLTALACVQPTSTPAARQAEPGAHAEPVPPVPGGPTNDESYYVAVESFDKAVDTLRGGSSTDRKNYTEQALEALEFTWIPSNTTLDRILLMEGVANLAHDRAGFQLRGADLWKNASRLRQRMEYVEPGRSPVQIRRMGLDELEQLAESLPREGQPATPIPAAEVPGAVEQVSLTGTAGHASDVIESKDDASEFDSWKMRASAAVESGEWLAAAEAWTQAFELGHVLLPPTDPELLAIQLDLARLRIAQDNLAEARRVLEELLANLSGRGLRGSAEWHSATALFSATYKLEGDYARAVQIDQGRVEECSTLAQGDPARLAAESDFNAMRLALGWVDVDEGIGEADLERNPRGGGQGSSKPAPRRLGSVPEDLPFGKLLQASSGAQTSGSSKPQLPDRPAFDGDPEAADAAFAADLAGLSQSEAYDRDKRVAAREGRAQAREALGDLDLAAELRRENLADCLASLDEGDLRVQEVRQALARTQRAQGDLGGARENQQKACDALEVALPPDHPALREARFALVALLGELDETEAALLLLERTLDSELANAVDHARLETLIGHAGELQRECRFEQAIALRRDIVATGSRILPAGSPARSESLRELAALLRVAGERAEARALEHQLCLDDESGTGHDNLRVRALEAAARTSDGSSHLPSVELSLVPSQTREAFELVAVIRDAVGVEHLSVVQDGTILDLDLVPPDWTPEPDGLGGRLTLRLRTPADRSVSVVTVVAENAWSGRTVRTAVALGTIL